MARDVRHRRRVLVAGAGRKPAAAAAPPRWKRPFSSMVTPGKALLGLVTTGVIGGVITLLFTSFGPAVTDAISSGPPIGVVVQRDGPLTGPGRYALPGTLPGHPQHLKITSDLAAAHPEAVPVRSLQLKLILEGRRSRPVVITDLRAHILTRSTPVAGTLLDLRPQGVNADVSGCMYLADPAPTLVTADGRNCDPAGKPYFATHNLTLNRGEQAVIDVRVMTSDDNPAPPPATAAYEWELLLRVVQNGTTTDVTIRDGTQPFRLTSTASDYQAIYAGAGVLNAVDPEQWRHDRFPDGHPR